MGAIRKLFNRVFKGNSAKVSMAEAQRLAEMQKRPVEKLAPEEEKTTVRKVSQPTKPVSKKQEELNFIRRRSDRGTKERNSTIEVSGTSKLSLKSFGNFKAIAHSWYFPKPGKVGVK